MAVPVKVIEVLGAAKVRQIVIVLLAHVLPPYSPASFTLRECIELHAYLLHSGTVAPDADSKMLHKRYIDGFVDAFIRSGT